MQINILNILIMDKLFQGVQGFKYFVHVHTYTHTTHTHTYVHTTQHNKTHTHKLQILMVKFLKIGL